MNNIFAPKDTNDAKRLSRLYRQGQLQRIYHGIYTNEIDKPIETIVEREWLHIISHIIPTGTLSHRSALELKPIPFKGQYIVFMTGGYNKTIQLPGLLIKVFKGNAAHYTEQILPGLARSIPAKMLLENLSVVRGKDYQGIKTAGKEGVEKYLVKEMRIHKESGLNQLRDEAKSIADALHFQLEFKQLNSIISALLSTNDEKDILTIATARAIEKKEPFDEQRLQLFEALYLYLKKCHLQVRTFNYSKNAFKNLSFFEVYFSNYIEGTEFIIDEAEDIVFQGVEVNNRHADSHDVLANFNLTSNYTQMSKTPSTADELIGLLKERHAYLMTERPDKKPGLFKDQNNCAGSTLFVDKNEVIGTLKQAFQYYLLLAEGLPRALFLQFLICEVHPFLDGNGRLSRIMMNAELVTANQCKIMLPTVHRDNYLNGLRLASREQSFKTYCKVMDQAQAYTASVDWSFYPQAREKIEKDYADKASDEGLPIFNRVLRILTLSEFYDE